MKWIGATMTKQTATKGKWFKVLLVLLLIVTILIITGSMWLDAMTYKPSALALEMASKDNVEDRGSYFHFQTETQAKGAIVFYQGGLVATESYAPLAQQLVLAGFEVFLPKMPLNLAIINTRAIDRIRAENPNAGPWYLGGHSLGGASAVIYLAKGSPEIDGLFLLGAYGTKDTDLSQVKYPVISITGSEDKVLNRESFEALKPKLPPSTQYVSIEGGNHSGFGSYGHQKGDGEAMISENEQLIEIVKLLTEAFGKE